MSKKTYTRKELVKKSKEVFEANKEADMLYCTEDGNFFLKKAKQHAVNHCNSIGQKKTMVIDRAEAMEQSFDKNKDGKLSAGERAERVEAAETIEALEALIKDESAKTVLEAAEKRRAELEYDAEKENKTQNHKD